MHSETRDVSIPHGIGCLLLITDPRQFFTRPAPRLQPAWRYLLSVSFVAALFHNLTGQLSTAWFGILVFFLNAVGMTCIFAGCVFISLRYIFRLRRPMGQVFTICIYASLCPVLISWIPGAPWFSEPWRWWVSAIGLSVCIPAGIRKTVFIIGGAAGIMYVLFWMLLSIV